MKPHWKDDPEEHDFPAALEYLSLLTLPVRAVQLVEMLKKAPTVNRKAKDLLRASNSALLPGDNYHVAKDLDKIENGHKLSPVLVIRGNPAVIADGYHRICAAYHLDENTDIPCRIA
jgi:hypothetical protein